MKYINAGAFALMVMVNYLSTSVPLNGQTPDQISDKYPTLFTPAGYVFAIWGVIYLLLAGFVVDQFLREHPRVERLGGLFAVSCAFNAAWIFAWHWEYLSLSLLIMLALLITLTAISLRLYAGRPSSRRDRWLVDVPFDVYLGWISVATIANISVVLYAAGWDGWGLGPVAWAVIMIGAAGVLGALSLTLRNNVPFVLVIMWALAGVGAANADRLVLAGVAWGAVLALGILLGWRMAKRAADRMV